MLGRTMTVSVLACLVSICVVGGARAEDPERAQDRAQDQEQLQKQQQEPIYGSHLMTEQERAAHRAQMRAAKTDEDRARIRKEHHERMELRAKERGLTIPDEPPARGGGKGPGGMGPGGGGMGPGGGGKGAGGGGR